MVKEDQIKRGSKGEKKRKGKKMLGNKEREWGDDAERRGEKRGEEGRCDEETQRPPLSLQRVLITSTVGAGLDRHDGTMQNKGEEL